MFGYPCPVCSQKLLAAPERAGQRTICPKCLKPIVIPKQEEPAKIQNEDLPPFNEPELDEVPIGMMPMDDPDEPRSPNLPTPMPEPRVPVRVAVATGSVNDPIPLQAAPAQLQPAAAFLVRNPESVADLYPLPDLSPVEPRDEYHPPEPSTIPEAYALPVPELPDPVFDAPPSTPIHRPRTYSTPKPQHYDSPHFSAIGTITGDHPAATLPQPTQGWNGGAVVFHPTEVRSADIAAELTQAISTKMQPPQLPPSDLRFSTGLWLLLTATGIALWVYCMIADMQPLRYVAIIGAVELIMGYLWVALAYGKRHLKDGILTLIPPVWVYRAAHPPHEPGYRPLRYVVAGAVLLALYVLGPKAQPTLYEWFGIADTSQSQPQDVTFSPHRQLLDAERLQNVNEMDSVLQKLDDPASILMEIPSEKPKLIASLRRLCSHARPEIRAGALRALWNWTQQEAKPEVFKAIQSNSPDEYAAGYSLIGNWNDAETVKFLVNRLTQGRLDDMQIDYHLIPALKGIGKSERGRAAIEETILPILETQDQTTKKTTFSWLVVDYGGPRTVALLEKMIKESRDQLETSRLKSMLNKIRDRNPS